jgi:hypothetical protein
MPIERLDSGGEALRIVEAHAAKWRKRASRHTRANGRRSDCEDRDLRRANFCENIANDIRISLRAKQLDKS